VCVGKHSEHPSDPHTALTRLSICRYVLLRNRINFSPKEREPSFLIWSELRSDGRGKPKMAGKQNRECRDDEFPLDAYAAVYTWIGKWAEEAIDPEQRTSLPSDGFSAHASVRTGFAAAMNSRQLPTDWP